MGSCEMQIPTVTLDNTLAGFYAEENRDKDERVVLVAAYPTGFRVLNQRYIYHDEDREGSSELPDGLAASERENAGETLRALGVQKFSFCVGDMPLVLFDPANGQPDKVSSFRASFPSNLAVLSPSQRPKLLFFSSPTDVIVDDDRVKLAPRLPMDGMENLPHTIHPDIHYELLSKRGLAIANFSTPASHLLDLKADWSQHAHPDSAVCPQLVRAWMNEVVDTISNRPLPFVMKLQQTIFGKGTYIIKTEESRASLLSELHTIMVFNANRTNKFNQHLMPATFVITDFVDCPETGSPSFAITFFVGRDGSYTFINCCEQTLSIHNTWDGSAITFSEQHRLEQHFSNTISDVAGFLHGKGYYGCVGIDVLEDKQGKQWVVDMNVRPPGSLVLGLLKGFLSVQRGFNQASLLSAMRVTVSKQVFQAKFSKELAEGRLIMTAWYQDIDHDVNWTSLIVGGETKEAVRSLVKRLDIL